MRKFFVFTLICLGGCSKQVPLAEFMAQCDELSLSVGKAEFCSCSITAAEQHETLLPYFEAFEDILASLPPENVLLSESGLEWTAHSKDSAAFSDVGACTLARQDIAPPEVDLNDPDTWVQVSNACPSSDEAPTGMQFFTLQLEVRNTTNKPITLDGSQQWSFDGNSYPNMGVLKIRYEDELFEYEPRFTGETPADFLRLGENITIPPNQRLTGKLNFLVPGGSDSNEFYYTTPLWETISLGRVVPSIPTLNLFAPGAYDKVLESLDQGIRENVQQCTALLTVPQDLETSDSPEEDARTAIANQWVATTPDLTLSEATCVASEFEESVGSEVVLAYLKADIETEESSGLEIPDSFYEVILPNIAYIQAAARTCNVPELMQ